MSGLLVAAITNTPFLSSSPSSSVRSQFTTRSVAWFPSDPLFGTSESSSSKKITQGADALALLKRDLTAFSDSPTYLFKSSGPLIEIKLALDSLETALATKVLPQPGGPQSRTPAGAQRPIYLKRWGFRIGSTMLIQSSALTLINAPTSFQVVDGTVEKPSLCALGVTLLDAFWKSSYSMNSLLTSRTSSSFSS